MPKRSPSFYPLAAFFALFVCFLYGPMIAIFVLSLQGPEGGLTFPVKGFSLHWLGQVFREQRVGSFVDAFQRSLILGLAIALLAIVIGVAASMAFRQRFRGARPLFYLTISSLVVPGTLISLGIGISFQVLQIQTNWFSSGIGAHLTWTVPFAFLILIGVFNRFNPAYEEAARDLGASDITTFKEIVLPLIFPGLIGIGILTFTLSYDEFVRTSLVSGQYNTLPLEVFGMTTNVTSPALYALGTLTTLFSFSMIAIAYTLYRQFSRQQQG
ncbi:MAG: ABC transporter permease [Leptolyngbya sp. RL_3_1]|nr:ABC transporter permease [Leptolyngbya sp. RL_3_1]